MLSDLSCQRGDRLLFENLSYTASSGMLIELKGENGTGKSSLLRILSGLLKKTTGKVALENQGETHDTLAAHAHYLAHDNALKPAFSVRENLDFWRDIAEIAGMTTVTALEKVGISYLIDLPVGVLSAGQKRRVAFARLLVARHPIWLLDEPTAALDHMGDKMVGELISNHVRQAGLVIAATHLPLNFTLPKSAIKTLNLADFSPKNAFRSKALS